MNNRKVKVCYVPNCTRLGYVAVRNTSWKKRLVCAQHHAEIKADMKMLAARA